MPEFVTRKAIAPSSPSFFAFSNLRQRVGSMVLLWLLGGAAVGILATPLPRGMIALLANAVAGMLLLPWLGLAFGLLGGRWKESLLGGVYGLTVGMAAALVAPALSPAGMGSLGLLLGGMVGATLPVMVRLMCRHLLPVGR